MKKTISFALLLCLLATGCNNSGKSKYTDPLVVQKLNSALTETVVLDAFKPPVAARIYAYANIAGYECLRHSDTSYHTLQGQLTGFDSLPSPAGNNYNWEIAAIIAFTQTAADMTYRDYKMLEIRDKLLVVYKQNVSNEVYERSVQFGEQVAKRAIAYLRKDGYGLTRTLEKYMVKAAEDKWQPTPPKYTEPCEPYWSQIKTFSFDSISQFVAGKPVPFSTDKSSAFYTINSQLHQLTTNLTAEQKAIGNYWDDNPAPLVLEGHLMETYKQISPGGHWVSIACNACKNEKKSVLHSSAITTMVAIAVSDGFKSCWHTKFLYETVRPVTYINKYIDPAWQPLIETPMFPEYTSAHSTISSAAATVLEHYFGSNYKFTDSTEVPYNKGVRSFSSFRAAANEVSVSRVYGGIHYPFSCDSGIAKGHEIGVHLINRLTTSPR
jgi:membrane-associated phospholipid phosphatase